MFYVVERLLADPVVRDQATCGSLLALEEADAGRFCGRVVDLARSHLRAQQLGWEA